MPLGLNFVKVLRDEVAKCDVVLVVIGPNWVSVLDQDGKRRLANPNDFVRIEVATALQRDIPVIPILLDGAMPPKPDQLPRDLKELALRNALYVRHVSFHNDMDRLIRALRGQFGETTANTPPAVPDGRTDEGKYPGFRNASEVTNPVPRLSAEKSASSANSSIKWELISTAIGIIGGVMVGFWSLVLADQGFIRLYSSPDIVYGVIIPAPIIMVTVAWVLRYWRLNLLTMRAWLSFGIIAALATQFIFWLGLFYAAYVMTPRNKEISNPGGLVGLMIAGVSVLLLLTLRLRRRRASTTHQASSNPGRDERSFRC